MNVIRRCGFVLPGVLGASAVCARARGLLRGPGLQGRGPGQGVAWVKGRGGSVQGWSVLYIR